MVYNFKAYVSVTLLLTGLWSLAMCGLPAGTYGAMLDELCQPDAEGSYDIPSLAEEAEAAGMPSGLLRRLLIKGYQDQTATNEMGRLLCIIVQMEEGGFLPDPLFLKLEEGLAKNASLSNIILAIERKIDDMQFAQRLISGEGKPKSEDDNVIRIARAMSAGLTRQKLQSLFSKYADAPVDMRVTAAEILAYGGAIGYAPRFLDLIVKTGLTARSFGDEWSFFVKVIVKARKQKVSDQQLADETIKTLSRNGTLNDLIRALGMNPVDVY